MVSDGVIATVRDLSPPGGAQINAVLAPAGIAQWQIGALSPAEFNSKNSFPIDGASAFQFAASVKQAKDLGLKSVYIVGTPTSASKLIEDTVAKAGRKVGVDVNGPVEVSFTAADYSPFAAKITSSNADGVIMANTGTKIV
jgi:ABC-type branched-subunit amino acid transport system substrate-binding protein